MKYKIGDKVLVSRDNWAWVCTIIAIRESNKQPVSHYQVRTEDDETFWALDFEVEDVPAAEPFEPCYNSNQEVKLSGTKGTQS